MPTDISRDDNRNLGRRTNTTRVHRVRITRVVSTALYEFIIPEFDPNVRFGPSPGTPGLAVGDQPFGIPTIDAEWFIIDPTVVGAGGGGITEETDPVAGPALAAHEAETTDVHGIADTAALATDADVSASVEAHRADSTDVHGIVDTSALVLTSDARLSDQRTPLDNSVTSAKIAAGAIGQSDIADGSIIEAKLASLAVTTGKIADGAVTSAKLAPALSLTGGLVVAGGLTMTGGAASFRQPSTANSSWSILGQMDGSATGLRYLCLLQSNVNVAADVEFYVLDNGVVRADSTITGGGADYAEWFRHEEPLVPGDVAGLNLTTGKVRKLKSTGDIVIGVCSEKPAFAASDTSDMRDIDGKPQDESLIGLIGKLFVDPAQIDIRNGVAFTKIGNKKVGYVLSTGRILLDAGARP